MLTEAREAEVVLGTESEVAVHALQKYGIHDYHLKGASYAVFTRVTETKVVASRVYVQDDHKVISMVYEVTR